MQPFGCMLARLVNDVFKALGDPSRRAFLDRLHHHNGQTLNDLCRDLKMTRQAATKHIAILAKANLIVPLWRGREKRHYLNPVPLRQICERWIDKYEGRIPLALTELERGLEETR